LLCQKFATLWQFVAVGSSLLLWLQQHGCACLIGRPRALMWSNSRAAMKLEIEQRQKQGIFILDLKGRLILGEEDLAVRQRLMGLLEAGRNKVVLSLKEVSDIDTTALGTLVFFALRFREAGGKLVLLHLGDSQARLSDMLKLNAVFESYQDEVDAVNSFFPERAVSRYDILDFVEEQEHRQ
jgi:anti-sigma B factor antagonist